MANQDLFAPGAGGVPKVVVGRDDMLNDFDWRVQVLQRGGRGENIVLVGPRGNGKTVLCRKIEMMAQDRGIPALALSGGEVPTVPDLLGKLAKPSLWQRWGLEELSPSIPEPPQVAGEAESALEEALHKCAAPKGLVVTLDEAHVAAPQVARALLNAAQMVANETRLLVVVAGTPALDWRLRLWSATFSERADCRRVRGLSTDEIREGLRQPFAQRTPEITVTEDAVTAVAEDCGGYPYFLQQWGYRLEQLQRRVIDREAVEAVREAVMSARRAQYGRRWSEMLDAGVVGAAEALARAGLAQRGLPLKAVQKTLREHYAALGFDAAAARCALVELADIGYIWDESGESEAYVAAIPTLAGYTLAKAESYDMDSVMANFGLRLEHWRQEQAAGL
ncbi:MAG: AAA family ATPase [Gammaproteobacteria bacterium]|nr:AAA family ATPase [Gammaproteobacteria bacterium]